MSLRAEVADYSLRYRMVKTPRGLKYIGHVLLFLLRYRRRAKRLDEKIGSDGKDHRVTGFDDGTIIG